MGKENEAKKKDLRGFTLSPNQATNYLEQYLGIEFTDRPSYTLLHTPRVWIRPHLRNSN